MEVKLATHAGFCFGVERAVDQVYTQLEQGRPIYTYGPIIHNEQVIEELRSLGAEPLSARQARDLEEGVVVIRSHGVGRAVQDDMQQRGLRVVDATCPFVKRIHTLAAQAGEAGQALLVVGNPGHPEVEGILGWSAGPAYVVENLQEAEDFAADPEQNYLTVAQTTFNPKKFQEIVDILIKKGYNINAVNTICHATFHRQEAALELAREADAMIVIGGKNSSNTAKLYEICKTECANTYYIQTLDDLPNSLPKTVRLVGITAGASTPNKLIEEVQNYVRINF